MSDLQVRGPLPGGTGSPSPFTAGTLGAQRVQDGNGHFYDGVFYGRVFTMVLAATTTGVAAGNIVAAAAAASTQFALFNPANSSKVLSLLRFGMGVISGTPGPGPVFHGYFIGVPTLAANGVALSNLISGNSGSIARCYASAGGAALTGGPAPLVHSVADFSATATAQAVPGHVRSIENLDGAIILLPGTGWAPLWSIAGTSLLNAYSITWEENPYLP